MQTVLHIDGKQVFVGIDWGASHHQLCAVDAASARRRQVRLAHDVAGLAQLDNELGGLGARLPVAVERAEGLLVEHLQTRGHLGLSGLPADRGLCSRALSDRQQQRRHLRRIRAGRHPLPICSPVLAELRALTRDRDRLLATQQRTEAQLRAILEACRPAAARLFSSIDRQITLAFIGDYPTPQAAAVVGTQRMARFLARNRYTGRVKPQVLVERLRANLLAGAAGTVAGKAHSALGFAELLGLLNQQLADYDDAIALAVGRHPDAAMFASFPGVGPIGTAVLLAEIGEDRAHYPTLEVLLAEAGLAPVTRASGRSCRVRFRYAANRNLREACTWWAYNSLKESTWASEVYKHAGPAGSIPIGRCAAWVPAGCGFCGAAGSTAFPTTPPST